MEDERKRRETLEEQFRSVIEEARMVLPGVQALFGFQLIAVFSDRFQSLPSTCVIVHLASLLLVALSIALIMTPAAYHRIAERGWVSESFCTFASRFLASAMVTLMIGLSLELYVVSMGSIADVSISLALALGAGLVFGGLWLAYPLIARNHAANRTRRISHHAP